MNNNTIIADSIVIIPDPNARVVTKNPLEPSITYNDTGIKCSFIEKLEKKIHNLIYYLNKHKSC